MLNISFISDTPTVTHKSGKSETPTKLFVLTLNQQVHFKLTPSVVIKNKNEDSVIKGISDMLLLRRVVGGEHLN